MGWWIAGKRIEEVRGMDQQLIWMIENLLKIQLSKSEI
jgi:hypothetical protein